MTTSSSPYTQPPWDFLLSASRSTLQSYELSRLGHAANLRKEISSLLDQWLAESAAAMLARLLIDHPDRSVLVADSASIAGGSNGAGNAASDNFLMEQRVPPHAAHARG